MATHTQRILKAILGISMGIFCCYLLVGITQMSASANRGLWIPHPQMEKEG